MLKLLAKYWQIRKRILAESRLLTSAGLTVRALYLLRASSTFCVKLTFFLKARVNTCADARSGRRITGTSITVKFSKRNPADPIDEGTMLCAMYAWDSNSFAGNEYYLKGMLSASGDPAAAACSTIAFLQCPYVNPAICSANLHTW